MKTYVITGATGNIGNIVTTQLLARGQKVKAIGRTTERLKELMDKSAEALVGNLANASFVNKAFAGADAVLCIVPGNPHSTDPLDDQHKIAEIYAGAVKLNKIQNVVLISSVGAHLRKGAGMVDGLGYLEEQFLKLKNINVLNLRPTYFMENILGQVGTIKQFGMTGSPLKADLSFAAVATKDIAQVAIKHLMALDFQGNIIEYILGERDVTYNEITEVMGKAIGKPDLKYVQFTYEDAKKGMVGSGFCSAQVANLMNGLMEGMNNGSVLSDYKRTQDNTTPTSIEEFSKIFEYLYNKK